MLGGQTEWIMVAVIIVIYRDLTPQAGRSMCPCTVICRPGHLHIFVFFLLCFLFFIICFAVTPHILQQVLLMQDCGPRGFDRSPGEIKRREVELGSHRWVDCIALLLSASSAASFWTLIMRLCSALLLKQQSAKYTSYFPLAGSPPP